MRRSLLFVVLAAALPACAQGVWYLDVHRAAPSLEGHYRGVQDGQPVDFDLKRDLALGRDRSPYGFALEYQGPRFALEASFEVQDYKGSNMIDRQVSIGGQTWDAQAQLDTAVKLNNYAVNWTIRFTRSPGAWVGWDLGVVGTHLDVRATGTNYLDGVTSSGEYKSGLPIPQLGPAAGWTSQDGRWAARGHYHFLAYKGASYRHAGADLRWFPARWAGVRAFYTYEHADVPNGSLKDDLEVLLDRSGAGFGVVVRF